MENLNWQCFVWMAAGFHPQPVLLAIAQWLAVYGAWLTVAVMLAYVWRNADEWVYLAGTVLLCLLSIWLGHRLAVVLAHPRPFMVGMSPAYIPHAVRGSLPSVHACALFALAFGMLARKPMRWAGGVALLVALLVGWARVYCGIHFPFDIVAGVALAGLLATVYAWLWSRYGLLLQPEPRPLAVTVIGSGTVKVD
ncbi:phosphatase PAP2 family protein [Comamonas sp. J-3]|uniref:phosphatase PAP2 family protein n=1 Tax=Comamonas trifloxystrobinivorans TaxID=3350256 RepID=UPI0037278FDE